MARSAIELCLMRMTGLGSMSNRQSGIVALVSVYRCGWLDNQKDHRTNIIHTVIQKWRQPMPAPSIVGTVSLSEK